MARFADYSGLDGSFKCPGSTRLENGSCTKCDESRLAWQSRLTYLGEESRLPDEAIAKRCVQCGFAFAKDVLIAQHHFWAMGESYDAFGYRSDRHAHQARTV